MKLTLVIITVVLALASTRVQAEPRLGGKGGPNLSIWMVEPSGSVDRTYRHGVSAGGYLQLRYLDVWVPQLEVFFTSRGTDSSVEGESQVVFKTSYIDSLFLARVELPMNVVTLYGLLGPELNVLLSASTVNFLGIESDIKDQLTDIDVGVLVGAGVAVGPFSWGTVVFEARYDRGFIDVTGPNESFTTKNQTIAFLVGYEYRRDRDRDGIADSKDRCPRQAEDRDGFEDSDGCPDTGHDSAAVTRYP